MRGFIHKSLSLQVKNPEGFNWVEMLVVFGIILAIASVSVPLLIHLTGGGH